MLLICSECAVCQATDRVNWKEVMRIAALSESGQAVQEAAGAKKKSLCLTEALLGQPEGYPYLYPRNMTLYPESSWMIALLHGQVFRLSRPPTYRPSRPFSVSGDVGVCQRLQRRGPPRILTGFPVRPLQAPVQLCSFLCYMGIFSRPVWAVYYLIMNESPAYPVF